MVYMTGPGQTAPVVTFYLAASFPFPLPCPLPLSSWVSSSSISSSLPPPWSGLSPGAGSSGNLLEDVDEEAKSGAVAALPNLLLFSITISFSHPFSRLSSAASLSSSSTRPERSEIDRSKVCVHCFFLTLNRAAASKDEQNQQTIPRGRCLEIPDAAVFRRRLSSETVC